MMFKTELIKPGYSTTIYYGYFWRGHMFHREHVYYDPEAKQWYRSTTGESLEAPLLWGFRYL